MTKSYYSLMLVLGLLASSCEEAPQEAPKKASTTDFTYSGTTQNFTPIQFSSRAAGAETFAWSFGDGGSSTEANPVHTFRRAGSYLVRLRATGVGGTTEVAKTLTLAQADTAAIIVARAVGNYRFGKVVRTEYVFQDPVPRVTRLRDTTLALISPQPRTLEIGRRRLTLLSSSVAWPVSTRSVPNYLFDDTPVPSNSAKVYLAQQGDSLIFWVRLGGLGNPYFTTYYGRKLP
ncbi:PKD domain-containing protein [Hymenobacter sp. B81]|uniref:PKD domain-containing protein n=1 Tax=Hymenobacter sp. B81 TaxID=3344878 RepID=UPI0037DC4D0C